jgi:hypothetical protein
MNSDGIRRVCRCAAVVAFVQLAACGAALERVGTAAAGRVVQLAVDGDRLLTHDGKTLRNFDISDRAKPRELGRLESPDVVSAMAFIDHVPYVEIGIRPNNLERVPSAAQQEWIKSGRLLVDERSYYNDYFRGVSNLARLELADPARPAVAPVANLTTPDMPVNRLDQLTVVERHGYASQEPMGIAVLDFRNPRQVRVAAALPTGQALAPRPPHLFVADGPRVVITSSKGEETRPGGLQVLDVSNPQAPKEIGRLDSAALGGVNATRIAAAGNYVYMRLTMVKGGGWGGADDFLATIDVSNAARPVLVQRDKIGGAGFNAMAVGAKTLYLLFEDGALAAYDISEGARPKRTSTTKLGARGIRIVVAEPWVYVGTEDGLEIYRLQ